MIIPFKGVSKEQIYEMIKDISKLNGYLPSYLTKKQVAYIHNKLEKVFYTALEVKEKMKIGCSLIEIRVTDDELVKAEMKPSSEDIINMGKQGLKIKYYSSGDNSDGIKM